MNKLDELLIKLLWAQLQSLGLFTEKDIAVTGLQTKSGIKGMYDRWLDESIAVLTRRNYLQRAGGLLTVLDTTPAQFGSVWQEWDQHKDLWLADPNQKAQVILVEAMLRALPEILTGKVAATDIMFPKSSMELVEGIYKNNPAADYFNETIANTVRTYIEGRLMEDPAVQVRIIEIGAGTGGTSIMVFRKLEPYREHVQEYCYTDVSKAFLMYAEKEYGPAYPYLTYKIFNAEAAVAGQGVNAGGYDLVIAANVLHATKNIRQTLSNTKAVLKKNGLILLNEISRNSLFTHLTFGLLEGWWLYEDPELRIPGCPGLSPETWQQALEREGFRSVFFPAQEAHELGQQIVVAESDGVVRQRQAPGKGASLGVTPVKSRDSAIGNKSTHFMAEDINRPLPETQTGRGRVTAALSHSMVEDYVKTVIIEKLSTSLKMDIGLIDLQGSFADYGVDSITGVNLVQSINQALMIEIQTTDIFDYSSVNQLTKYILTKYKDVIARDLGQTIKQTADQSAPASAGRVSSVTREENHNRKTPAGFGPNRFFRGRTPYQPGNGKADANAGAALIKEPIAIIGMSGRFAKSKDLDELWGHLANGDDLVEKVFRWDLSKYYPKGAQYCDYGSFIEDIDRFDPLFFNISGMEATYMDPQQRVFLEEAWKALEDAGYVGTGIEGRKCGVYVGSSLGDYQKLIGDNPPAQALWGYLGSLIPARIAYYLNLQGPAIAIDTACSSSLVAIHVACQGLWAGETEMAIAGGVFIHATPQYYLSANRAGMLSPTGHCHTFDDRADGMVPGEATGVVVLKRLQEAMVDGDHIYGVIRGSGINQDGATNGITAPSLNSQERLERYVYDTFQINPAQIQMVEAHGTGTKLGDPIEYHALTRAFRNYTDKQEYCAIGSIKTNIGHTQLAAGITGVIKILLSLKNRQIPPSLHFQSGNSNIQFQGSPFFVNTKLKEWDVEPGVKRCAVVSAFGASGTNAHIVIEEAPELDRYHPERPGYLIVLSARTFEQLRRRVEQMVRYCERMPGADCGNISYTLLVGRKHFNHRLACIVRDRNELVAFFKKWLEKGKVLQIYLAELRENEFREQPSLKQYGNQCIQDCKYIESINISQYMEKLSAIADLYVQGYALEFEQMFTDGQYSRISLPTYPFTRERYWVDNTAEVGVTGQSPLQQVPIHPLVHQNTSDFSEQRFSSTFTGCEDFMAGHLDGGTRILPEFAQAEMARAAFVRANGLREETRTRIRLKDVIWTNPMAIAHEPFHAHIGLFPEEEGKAAYQIYSVPEIYGASEDSAVEPIIYSQGSIEVAPLEDVPTLDLGAIQEQCNQVGFSAAQFYEAFKPAGAGYSVGYHAVEQVYTAHDQIVVKLSLPSSIVDTLSHFVLHPGLMDAVLQAASGVTGAKDLKLFRPYTVHEMEIWSGFAQTMWAVARFPDSSRVSDGKLKLDIHFCDNNGRICVRIKGLEAQDFTETLLQDTVEAVSQNAPDINTPEDFEVMTFEEVWQEEALRALANDFPVTIKTMVCFLSRPENQQAVAAWMQTKCPQTNLIFISQGATYQKHSRQEYNINRHDLDNFREAFRSIREEAEEIDAILYLWPLEDHGCIQDYSGIVHNIQAVVSAKLKTKLLILAAEFDNQMDRCYLESWTGFERSLGMVLPNTKTMVVCQSTGGQNRETVMEVWMEKVWPEMGNYKSQSVLYQDGKRFVHQIQPEYMLSHNTLLRSNATYLITGGCGGLGLLFAEHFAKTRSVNLVLTGRSPLDPEKQSKIKAIESLGSRVIYLQADVCDPSAMQEGLRRVREEFGEIHGVIHAAGIQSGQIILGKEMNDFQEVLDPKIKGTLVLDELLGEEPLDFICYFSSSSAVLGDFGSCDYAVANRFLMSYAHYRNVQQLEGRKRGKAVVINWPLWKAGGMGFADDEMTKMYLKSSGQDYLETKAGLAMFESLLAQNNTQHLVLAGQPSRIRRFLGLGHGQSAIPSPVISAHSDGAPAQGRGRRVEMKGLNIEQCLEWDLKEITGNLLRISRDKLDSEANLADFGFDSISLAEFATRLTGHYGIEVTPALFYGYSTIEKLTRYFFTEHQEAIQRYYQEDPSAPDVFPSQEVAKAAPRRQRQVTSRFTGIRTPQTVPEPIAIIGMSGRFPGARNIDEMWTILATGQCVVHDPPEDRFSSMNPGNNKWKCGWIPGVKEFDPIFFEISPKEAETMDPRQRLLLQEAWNALEDAGYGTVQLRNNKIGMFVGVENGDYQFLTGLNAPVTSNHTGVLAARLAYFLNFSGPNMAINTACSSGLVAAHQAASSLRNGECDTAIAAGVNLMLAPETFTAINQAGMLSEDGKCHAFDKRANGMVPGEAVAVVVLKLLSKAEADEDPIYAVIRGSGINYDGKTNGITAPSGISQTNLLKTVYDQYRINPEEIEYVVTHGTGTKLGDPVEINALYDAFKGYTQKHGYAAITSTKTNFGHTFAASGLVSLISLVQAFRHETIPASLHCEQENDYINWKESPFYVNKTNKPWPENDGKGRTGAVSAFGMSGTNAHMSVQSYTMEKAARTPGKFPYYLLAFSAKTREALREKIANLTAVLETGSFQTQDLLHISYTLSEGRQHFNHRCAFVIRDIEDAIYVLKQVGITEKLPNLFEGTIPRGFKGQKAIQQYAQDLPEQLTRELKQESNNKYQEILYALADLYCQGYEIPWRAIYGDNKPRRIHLPTYPFARDSYWITERPLAPDNDTAFAGGVMSGSTSHAMPVAASVYQDTALTPGGQMRPVFTPYSLQSVNITGPVNPNTSEKPRGISLHSLSDNPTLFNIPVSHMQQPVVSSSPTNSTISQPGLDIEMKQAAHVHSTTAAETLREDLAASLAGALAMKPGDVDVDTNFIDMGLDSIIGVEWIQSLNKQYGTSLTGTVVYDYPSIRELSGMLAKELDIQESAVSLEAAIFAPAESPKTQVTSLGSSVSTASLPDEIITSLANALGMKRNDIDMDTKFIDLGLDSIIGVEWIQSLNKQYETSFTATAVYDYPNVRAFAGFLEQEMIKQGKMKITPAESMGSISLSSPPAPEPGLEQSSPELSPNQDLEQESDKPTGEAAVQSVLDLHEIEPGIVQITMQDRVNKNTFSMELIISLMEAFESIQTNPDYKVVILTGYDNYFACGGSKEGLAAIHGGQAKLTDINIFSLPLNCNIPVIAAMQGHGIGGGWCMGMFSDFIVMSRDSTYTCNHMKYGFTPGDGATLIFPEKFGLGLAQEILFTGRKFRGSELASKGIPYPVLPKKEVLPYAIQLARELAGTPRESLFLLKAHMTKSIKKRLTGIIDAEWEMQQKTFVNKPEVMDKIFATFSESSKNDRERESQQSAFASQPEMQQRMQSFFGRFSQDNDDKQTLNPADKPDNPISAGPSNPELIHLNRIFQGRPVFWLHGEGGGVEGYQGIAQKSRRPFYGIQARGRMTEDPPLHGIIAMASYYTHLIQSVQPEGPYDLGGYSLGGVLAYEVACRLQDSGQTVHTIAMLDSLDAARMKTIDFTMETKILQAVNMSLIIRLRQEPEKLFQTLIHQKEVNPGLEGEALLQHLITLGKTRGLSTTRTETELFNIFLRNLKVQGTLELEQFSVSPLPYPQAVTCYYFRNKSGSFFGEFEPYLTSLNDKIDIDYLNYWEGWEGQLPDFHMIDVEASNHVTMLFDPKSCDTIKIFCEQLYSESGISPEFLETFKHKSHASEVIGLKEEVAHMKEPAKKKAAAGKRKK